MRRTGAARGPDPAAPRTVVVVGATSGVGRSVALKLAERGHRVIAVGRDAERAATLRDKLRRRPGPDPEVLVGDVSTVAGRRAFTGAVPGLTGRIDALINNAGVMLPRRRVNEDGHELNFAVHHLAPFAVTGALLPLLRKGSVPGDPAGRDRPRVVNVNSAGHHTSLRGHRNPTLDFADLQAESGYEPALVYSRTKLANMLFTLELARRHGDELIVNALHPGVVRSDLGREFPRLLVLATQATAISTDRAAPAVIRLAVEPVEGNGGYYDRAALSAPSPPARDRDAAARLWEVTERLIGPFQPSPAAA
ncbi:SDR family NAD(P)-dependent oxidoreductase [Actinomadura rugatobispora]|uniref:SDR family NAD(P)-dependent oxidoreductase n=1 Tax=Actinomadura rugatobispora TaxID=1994 RepID=A0ABW1ACB8_9ACTN|nr:SDR family oxidoreductase [Actinomadura rugatobispora]